MEEQFETLEYCSKCRDYHLVNEELVSWQCPVKGERPQIRKPLDAAMEKLDATIQIHTK